MGTYPPEKGRCVVFVLMTYDAASEGRTHDFRIAYNRSEAEDTIRALAGDPQVCQQGTWLVWEVPPGDLVGPVTLTATVVDTGDGYRIEWGTVDDGTQVAAMVRAIAA